MKRGLQLILSGLIALLLVPAAMAGQVIGILADGPGARPFVPQQALRRRQIVGAEALLGQPALMFDEGVVTSIRPVPV